MALLRELAHTERLAVLCVLHQPALPWSSPPGGALNAGPGVLARPARTPTRRRGQHRVSAG